ncbi:D-arabinose 1-dehydrogenase-like Zn-dependent alcohol dehydrogenase [Kitasatospora sp. MAA19]|uniref:alcohol dehydrogenase catalytic domain-containing protein n=1 Tax=Kitasatospora sp. MAA19 TaxID=3035090 RepID=UPI002473CD5B|nr:alcohol dehydrogenase catalytic domain-containing protein [Kitasatospora sp. MAA19]MDH6709436.1 D-arabinose 1-dehydrogenase-like Zn-dependent alcohol dehydrogenase [Kitasatospora sp. MAA19]
MSQSTMRAVQAVEAGKPFEAAELPVPEPGPGQVRVRVRACGVCGGENVVRYGLLGVRLPRVPGHEIAGEVDAVGPGVTTWQVGDRAGIGWHGGSCHVCDPCRRGDFANCVEGRVVAVTFDGGYAEYTVAPQDALARIPDALSFEEAGPLMCAGITTFNALRHSGAGPGDTVAVQGIGGLGHLAVQFADKMGFRTVAINRGRTKEDLSRRLGADEYIDSEEGSAGEALAKLGGAAAVLSTVGHSPSQADLVQGLAPNGRLVVIATGQEPISVNPELLVFGRRAVAGWYSGHAKDSEEAMAFAALKGVRPMVETHPLDQAETVFQTMNKAKYRAVLVP